MFALVYDVMASWPPPQPIQKLHMLLEQVCITDLTLSKRRLNKDHYKTLHIISHLLIGRKEKLAHPNVLSQQHCGGMRGVFETHTTHI